MVGRKVNPLQNKRRDRFLSVRVIHQQNKMSRVMTYSVYTFESKCYIKISTKIHRTFHFCFRSN